MEMATADFYRQKGTMHIKKISLQVVSSLDKSGLVKKFLSFSLMVQLLLHTVEKKKSSR